LTQLVILLIKTSICCEQEFTLALGSFLLRDSLDLPFGLHSPDGSDFFKLDPVHVWDELLLHSAVLIDVDWVFVVLL
jgi:hypothetical protein